MSDPTTPFALRVPIDRIEVEPDRGRKTFTRIAELADSIKRVGMINPILCRPIPGKEGYFFLIAGERRWRASISAGLTTIPITFRENLSDAELKIIELEENTCRQELTWIEEVELHRQIDELLKKTRPEWDQQKTAAMINISQGHLSEQITMAKKLRADPTLKDRVKHLPMRQALQVINQTEEAEKMTRLAGEGKISITTDLRLGSCVDLIKQLPDQSVHCLVTDPPYGLEKLESIRESASQGALAGHALMSEHHNMTIDGILAILRQLAPELRRVLRPGAHCYVFCGQQYVDDFIQALSPLEWQPPFLYWDRGKGTSPGYGYNYINRTETIIHFHNPPRSRRLKDNHYNILEFPEVSAKLRRYPTQKPEDLLKFLIEQSTNMGELVLDCFAGSASTLEAARKTGRRSVGFEINPESWQRAQLYLAGAPDQPSLLPDQQPEARKDTATFGG